MSEMPALRRMLGLPQATVLNMIDMVGIGPFINLPIIMAALHGWLCLVPWIIGALLACCDGFVWSELGAAYPAAGGSYVFLQKLYSGKTGRLMAFLFVWQTCIQAPLVIASGAIGFSQYLSYLFALSTLQQKMVSGAVVILIVMLLYRNVKNVSRISTVLWIITVGTIVWLVFSGLTHFDSRNIYMSPQTWDWTSAVFWFALGNASIKSVYSYLGYYNVCHLGAEIKEPERNIPRSIFISIIGIIILYLLMQISILGVVPNSQITDTTQIVSVFFKTIYGQTAAFIATVCILVIAFSSLLAVTLGYSRIPFAAARDGQFFSAFGKIHPTKNFPHISLLTLGALAFIFSLLFKLKEVITAIITMRILIQFLGQSFGIFRFHTTGVNLTYRMPLFPIPVIISIIIWLFIFCSSGPAYIGGAIGIIVSGILLFLVKENAKSAG